MPTIDTSREAVRHAWAYIVSNESEAAKARLEEGRRDALIERLWSLSGDLAELQEDWRRTMEALLPFVEDEQVREAIKRVTPKR